MYVTMLKLSAGMFWNVKQKMSAGPFPTLAYCGEATALTVSVETSHLPLFVTGSGTLVSEILLPHSNYTRL